MIWEQRLDFSFRFKLNYGSIDYNFLRVCISQAPFKIIFQEFNYHSADTADKSWH